MKSWKKWVIGFGLAGALTASVAEKIKIENLKKQSLNSEIKYEKLHQKYYLLAEEYYKQDSANDSKTIKNFINYQTAILQQIKQNISLAIEKDSLENLVIYYAEKCVEKEKEKLKIISDVSDVYYEKEFYKNLSAYLDSSLNNCILKK